MRTHPQLCRRAATAAISVFGLVIAVGCSPTAVTQSTPTLTATASAPAQPPTTAPTTEPAGTSTPTAGGPTDTATPTALATTTADRAVDVGGNWVGTITEGGDSQGIRFALNQLLGVITGAAILESGDVQQVNATLAGNMLTLVYEGTITGDMYSGTFTRYLSDQLVGRGTFEATREQ
jgi:hypothetical protein